MIANRVLRSCFGCRVDDRDDRLNEGRTEFGNILLTEGFLTFLQSLLHIVGHAVKLLGSYHQINMG